MLILSDEWDVARNHPGLVFTLMLQTNYKIILSHHWPSRWLNPLFAWRRMRVMTCQKPINCISYVAIWHIACVSLSDELSFPPYSEHYEEVSTVILIKKVN